MKHFVVVALLCAVLIPGAVGASEPARQISFDRPSQPLEFERIDDPLVAEQAIRGLMALAAGKQSPRLGTRAVSVDWALPAILIPAAGSLQGGGGTFFRSDVTLVSHALVDQEILIIWIPRGVDGRGQPSFRATLPADTPPVTTRDFVGSLGLSGLGSLLITGVEPGTTTPDPDALLHGFSRIWTPQPGSAGTVSQPFTSQNADMMIAESVGMSMGLRQDNDFRTNAGVVNLSLEPRSFLVAAIGDTDKVEFMEIALPPLSMQQVAIPAGNYGAVTLMFNPMDEGEDGWAAYGTSVDNLTGDGWVSSASLPY